MTKIKTAEGKYIPSIVFQFRVRDEEAEGGAYHWQDITTDDLFNGKKDFQ